MIFRCFGISKIQKIQKKFFFVSYKSEFKIVDLYKKNKPAMQNNTNVPKPSLADHIPDVVFSNILKYLDPLSQYRLCLTSKAYKEVFVNFLEDKHLLEKARNLSIICRYINKRLNKCKDCRKRLLYEEVLQTINSVKKSFLLLFDGIDLTIRLSFNVDSEIKKMVKGLNKKLVTESNRWNFSSNLGKKLVYYHGYHSLYWPLHSYKIVIDFYSVNGEMELKRVPLNNILDSVITVT
jgi:hypothetical protein